MPGGERESTHFGFEAGLDAELFDLVTLGYRIWLPDGNQAKWLAEESEPVYAGPRSHRARVALFQDLGLVKIDGRLDLVFADGADKVQYLTVTSISLVWDALLFTDSPLP